MEVYVDDLLVRSKEHSEHLVDLHETFTILKQYKMKLNPTKCAFGVDSSKFLNFIVLKIGVKANT